MTVFMTSKNFISSSYIRLYFLHQLLRWTNCTESGFRITFLEWCERSCVTSCWAVLDHELNWSMFIIMMQNKGELGAMGQKCSLVRKSLLHHSSHWFGLHKMNASSLLHWNKIQLFYGVRNSSFSPCGGSVSSLLCRLLVSHSNWHRRWELAYVQINNVQSYLLTWTLMTACSNLL